MARSLHDLLPLLLLCLCGTSVHAQGKPPNIVVILADDMGYGDPGCYNKDSRTPTPHIDKLAQQGMRFLDAHSPSAVCTPTRYAILTGRYAWRSRLKLGVLHGYDPLLIESGRLTLPMLLRQAGYRTACIGKWHLGLGSARQTDYAKPLTPGPRTVGFDYFFGITASLDMPPFTFLENDRAMVAPSETIAAGKHRREGGDGFWRAGAIAPGFKHEDVLPRITKEAVAYLERQAKESAPFFLYLPLTGPHTPWLPTREFQGKSGAGWYGDFVVHVDSSVGAILAALARLGLDVNTLVVFTSDNGAHWLADDIRRFGHRANLRWRGQKADIWEGGHRVPFVARWPGKTRPGSTSEETISLVDLMATAAALVGNKLPDSAGEDSYNLLPLLRGEARAGPLREATVYHSLTGMFGLRKGDWVLVEGLGSGGFTMPQKVQPQPDGPKGQLYNLRTDPSQERNVYLEQPQLVAQMQALLDRYRQQGHSRPAQ